MKYIFCDAERCHHHDAFKEPPGFQRITQFITIPFNITNVQHLKNWKDMNERSRISTIRKYDSPIPDITDLNNNRIRKHLKPFIEQSIFYQRTIKMLILTNMDIVYFQAGSFVIFLLLNFQLDNICHCIWRLTSWRVGCMLCNVLSRPLLHRSYSQSIRS